VLNTLECICFTPDVNLPNKTYRTYEVVVSNVEDTWIIPGGCRIFSCL